MNPKEKLAALQQEMRAILDGAKAAGREITEEEMTTVEAKATEAEALKAGIDRMEKAAAIRAGIGEKDADDEHEQPEVKGARTLGDFAKDSGMFDRWREKAGRRSSSTDREFKAATDPFFVGNLGQTQYGPVVPTRLRRLTIADLLASGTLSATSLTYPQQGAVTGVPAAVGEGQPKPQINFAFTNVTEALSKLAAWTKVSDESMEDTPYLVSVINSQLVARLQIVEEDQILNGNGTTPNLRGLLQRSGIQSTGAAGDKASANLDSIYHGIVLVETGAALAPVDGIVINPADYEKIRTSKDGNGQYFGGGPFTGAYGNDGFQQQPGIWGRQTVVTPAIAAGIVLVGSFAFGAQLFRKGGIRVDTTNSDVDDFEKNLVAIRAEERLLLAVYYPAAFCKVTLGAAPDA